MRLSVSAIEVFSLKAGIPDTPTLRTLGQHEKVNYACTGRTCTH